MPNDSGKQLITEEQNDMVINQILGLSEQPADQDESNQHATENQLQEIDGQQVRTVLYTVNYKLLHAFIIAILSFYPNFRLKCNFDFCDFEKNPVL